jgi:peptidyl-prolyl cis-trans isomerase C
MRRLAIVEAVLAATLASVACTRVPAELAAPEPLPKPEPAAVVETEPLYCDGSLTAFAGEHGISIDDFNRIDELELQKYSDRGRDVPNTAAARYHRSISERLIYQALLALEAAKLGVEYDPAALEHRELAARHGIVDWAKHLRGRGESDESLRGLYVAELRERAVLEHLGLLEVTDEEVLAEYEKIKTNYDHDAARIRASHILIVVDEHTTEAEAQAQAEAVYTLAVQPDADFAALAREHSKGPSARKGGELGIFAADRMVEDFSNAAFKLKPGEVAPPVKTKFGFHIIKVHGVWGPGVLPIEALDNQLRERLVERKYHAGRSDLKARLFEQYAPVNCVEAVAYMRGLDWPKPPDATPEGD